MEFLRKLEPLWLVLVVIGGLNYGLVALFDWNLLTEVFGTGTLTDIVYVVIGIAALTFVPRVLTDLRVSERLRARPTGA